jgi:hypothetical protein
VSASDQVALVGLSKHIINLPHDPLGPLYGRIGQGRGKSPERQSEHQKEFQRKLHDAGGRYVLAYSLDDVKAQVETALKLD